jgi:DNA-binding transcriptional MocR family regulator
VISFARGAASVDLIDVAGLRESAQEALASPEAAAAAVAYGTADGHPALRAWIAEQHDTDVANVIVTNGSMHAGSMLMDVLIRPGDHVVVERPTYDRTLLGLRERQAVVHALETDADGIDVDAIARLVAAGTVPRLVHVIPTFQNPGGSTLSGERRERLCALADEHGFLVLEDDPYRMLRFSGDEQPLMVDRSPNVVHASSFSKTVCPGIRVGYLVGPEDLIARIRDRATRTYISPNLVAQAIVHRFCVTGRLEASIASFRRQLRERMETLTTALSRALPEARFTPPDGGYFLWVEMPDGFDAVAFADAAAEAGVVIVPGADFVPDGGRNAFRLAYSGVAPEEIEAGVAILARLARPMLEGLPAAS